MTKINLVNGEAARANVRSTLDLSAKKKPWDKGFVGGEEFAQKAEYQKSLGDSGRGLSNKEKGNESAE